MKVAFYLDNSKHKGIKYLDPALGNPGVGGTEYIIWSTSYYLNELYEDIEVILLSPIIEDLYGNMNIVKCTDHCDAVRKAKKMGVDIFIFRDNVESIDIFNVINEEKLNSIMWSHNYQNLHVLNKASDCKYIKRNICVGKEQYDKLRDHRIFEKLDYIYNSIDLEIYKKFNSAGKNKKNIICYMAAIEPLKGFHNVAKIFSDIEKEIPDVELHVIGSAKLYDTNKKLGIYNLAEENYEKTFIHYLTDDKGNIKKNVKFWGVLNGNKKLEIMSNSKVGIANVPGYEETFCLVALEFESLGVPVIGGKGTGLLDTINDGETGILVKSNKDAINKIIKLLKNNDENVRMSNNGLKFIESKFNIDSFCKEWRRVLYEVFNDENVKPKIKTNNYWHDLKWLREINRIINKYIPFKNKFSIIEYRHIIANKIKELSRIVKKLKRSIRRSEFS